jgi:GMP synthase-like glutamine amidotransferase
LRIHYLQHVAFEDAANIGVWAAQRGHTVTHTRLDLDERLPAIDAFDLLAVMGGPMNIYEHDQYPWLVREKEFIRAAIDRGRFVLGVCLGAQLAADVLGGRVVVNAEKEIGWLPTMLTDTAGASLLSGLPVQFTPFHWHGDTFAIPPGAVHLARSEACRNQAFQYGEHVLGLQFHLDYSPESVQKMLNHCSDELVVARYIQQPGQMLPAPERFAEAKRLLYDLLDRIEQAIV